MNFYRLMLYKMSSVGVFPFVCLKNFLGWTVHSVSKVADTLNLNFQNNYVMMKLPEIYNSSCFLTLWFCSNNVSSICIWVQNLLNHQWYHEFKKLCARATEQNRKQIRKILLADTESDVTLPVNIQNRSICWWTL